MAADNCCRCPDEESARRTPSADPQEEPTTVVKVSGPLHKDTLAAAEKNRKLVFLLALRYLSRTGCWQTPTWNSWQRRNTVCRVWSPKSQAGQSRVVLELRDNKLIICRVFPLCYSVLISTPLHRFKLPYESKTAMLWLYKRVLTSVQMSKLSSSAPSESWWSS